MMCFSPVYIVCILIHPFFLPNYMSSIIKFSTLFFKKLHRFAHLGLEKFLLEVYVDIQKDLKLVKVQEKRLWTSHPTGTIYHHTTHSQGSCITAEEEAEM